MDSIVPNSYPHSGMQVKVTLVNEAHTMILPIFLSMTWEPVLMHKSTKFFLQKEDLGQNWLTASVSKSNQLHVDIFRFFFIHLRYVNILKNYLR